MKKLIGILVFFALIYGLDLAITDPDIWASNHFNISQRFGLSGILCLGAGILIITGGIDLSIGSVVSLSATVFAWLILDPDFSVPLPIAMLIVLVMGAAIGTLHGILVTYVRVQAFIVTLCGLFAYRGIARWITNDDIPRIRQQVEAWNVALSGSFLHASIHFWVLLLFFVVATIFLHFTIYGRYFFAIGSNEKAAHYSGINVDWYRILAYVICSTCAAVYGLLYAIHYMSVQPSSTGNMMELIAIAGAVFGGCSLRGGEGTTIGMLVGTAILTLLSNLINMLEIKDSLEPTVIGVALLACAILDEVLRHGVGWRDIAMGFRSVFGRRER
jgi:ribose transport system permease protein